MKGLPDIDNLNTLARSYLEQAHDFYPDLVQQGIVPPNTEATIDRMAKSFTLRFINDNHISKLMANPLYAGTRIYNRPRTVWDKDVGAFARKSNPESEWVVKDMPELRIIEEPLWQRLRTRAEEVVAKSPRTGKKLNRKGTSMPECEINTL